MAEHGYTDSYVAFMAECKQSYEDLCAAIARGDAPAGRCAKVTIDIPARVVDAVRFDILAASVEANHG